MDVILVVLGVANLAPLSSSLLLLFCVLQSLPFFWQPLLDTNAPHSCNYVWELANSTGEPLDEEKVLD